MVEERVPYSVVLCMAVALLVSSLGFSFFVYHDEAGMIALMGAVVCAFISLWSGLKLYRFTLLH